MREGWEYKKFENCIVKSPKLKQVKKEAYNNGSQYPIISQEEKFISGYCDDESMVCHIDRPIVVFGDHTRVLKYIDFDFVVGADGVKVIIPIKSIDSKFLLYFLQWYNIPNLGYSRHYKLLKDVMVPIPNCTTQQTIISELDKLNKLIQIKKEQLKDYDALAQSIFYEMFGDPVENEKGWEVKELIETVSPECKISYGIVQPGEHVEDGVSIVRPVDMVSTFISKDGLKKTTKEISNSYSRTILSGKELLVCVRGTTGVVSLVDESLQGANVTRGIAPLLFSENVERWFMYYQVKSSSVRGVISSLTRGIALKQINMSDLRKIRLILPPLSLQQSFAHKIEQIERQKAAVQSTITDLETLLAARMQYWFD